MGHRVFNVKWKLKGKRSAENKLLYKYCRKFGGITFTEVRLGDKKEPRKARRVDAVRFLRHQDRPEPEIVRYDPENFADRLSRAAQKGEVVKVIEVKKTLNRSAIGQVIFAEWYFRKRDERKVEPKMTIICDDGPELLKDFCKNNKIAIWSPSPRKSGRTIND
jgi:hypothetical protein